MKPRERVAALLDGKPVDRIPNGLGATETMGMHIAAYARFREVLGLPGTPPRMHTFMSTALFDPDVLEAMESDFAMIGSNMSPPVFYGPGSEKGWKPERLFGMECLVPGQWEFVHNADGSVDWQNWRMHCPPGGLYFDWVPAPDSAGAMLAVPDKLFDPKDLKLPHELNEEQLRRYESTARWLYENTDYALTCGETITDLQLKPDGFYNWIIRMKEEPQAVREILEKAVDASIDQAVQLDQAIGGYCNIICMADDIGDNRGVLIGPELWREIYKPSYKRLFSAIHQRTRFKISLHSCGSVAGILDDLVECGVDMLNPVQISAGGMEPGTLKEKHGKDIVFCGGCFDAIRLPPQTGAETVYQEVKNNLEVFKQGGGYVFAGVHNMPGDTPQSHIEAIWRAYTEVCRY